MPRKKTIQHKPLEESTLPDGTIVEIRDDSCRVIGRGLHKRDAYEKKRDEVLEKVANDYITPNGRKKILPKNDYLSSPTKFTYEIFRWGIDDSNTDESNLRKKLYRDIKTHITALENALKNKGK